MASFGEANLRCRENFESLLQSRLDHFDPALTRLEHLIADVERSVDLLKKCALVSEKLWC